MKRLNARKVRINVAGWLFIAPLVVYFIIFQLTPMVMALVYSFTDWNMRSDPSWVGLLNYKNLLLNTDNLYPHFWPSLWVTTKYMLMSIPASVVLAVVVAAMLNSKIKGERFFKTAFYVPSVTVSVAIAAMWTFMLDPMYGMINQLLGTNIDFLGQTSTALPTLALMSVWGGLGYNVLIVLSAMKNIDASLYEAAEMDGAGSGRRFISVTVPSILPTIFFIVITSVIGGFQAFDQMFLMTGGGPQYSTYTYLLGLYNEAFGGAYRIGIACAMSYILFIIILIITFIQFKVLPQDLTGENKKGGKKHDKHKARQ